MAVAPESPHRNQLLASLSDADRALLQPDLVPVALAFRRELERPNKPIEHVYFIEAGVASVIGVQNRQERGEVGQIGCEGMTGSAVILANDRSPNVTYVQVAGSAQRIASAKLRNAMRASRSLQTSLLRYVHAFLIQVAHTAMTNARATLDERVARWILMVHDRIGDDALPLTHESLSVMLGVRRPGITEAVKRLKDAGLLDATRGKIVVLDRNGIEGVAGESYGSPEAEYRRLVG
jgi:CRP-like cAMP-binding protein